jgi:RimJ/RimL family protein N-acetyltransferase
MTEDFVLTGERAALGPLKREHLPSFARWINDPEVRRGLAYRGLANEDAELKWYEQMTEAGREPRPTAIGFSRRAYERAGFRMIGRRRDSVHVLGRRWDSFLMDATAADFENPVLGRLRPGQ